MSQIEKIEGEVLECLEAKERIMALDKKFIRLETRLAEVEHLIQQ